MYNNQFTLTVVNLNKVIPKEIVLTENCKKIVQLKT